MIMTTEVRTFTADSMQHALDIVRQEMGADAVILHTRHVEKRRLFPWLKSRQEVEITAGTGAAARPTPAKPAAVTPAAVRRLVAADDLAPPPQLLKASPKPRPESKADPAPIRPTRTPTPVRADALLPRTAPRPSVPPVSEGTAEIHKRLDALQQALAELSRQAKVHVADQIPVELFPLYSQLTAADVDEAIARDLVLKLKRDASIDQLANQEACTALLTGLIEQEIRCAPPITPGRGRKVAALVGPTGVGTTTTIAKLAANFRLQDRLKLGLVTVDTYRIAAVEQLRTYAEIIDLPMKVVTSPSEMRRALDDLSGVDLVLIDTAGRSPNDDLKLQELKSFLVDTGVDEVHLVLSLAVGARVLESAAEKFSGLRISSVVLTKLDEAVGSGGLLSVARRIAWPISYVTTGQNVPDDIEPAHAARLAHWLMGEPALAAAH
jgi:flagellar biosynthesis protein FlhF